MSDSDSLLEVPVRKIPVPGHLSPEARMLLSSDGMSNPEWPEQYDIDAWRRIISEMDAKGIEGLTLLSKSIDAQVNELSVGGVTVYAVTPSGVSEDHTSVYMDIHGGALLWGGGPSCRAMGIITAGMMQARVFAVDYRMPPDHPYPAAIDDCLAVYRYLVERFGADNVIVGGASAGGNISAATILRARDEGLPLPAAAVLLTPELDLTESGDSFNTLLGVDTALTTRLMPANLLYADGHDLADPYLSPLFGDFSKGFPPTFLQSGTRDLFLSNTVRMHTALRAAGVSAELFIQEAATHIGFMFGPEAEHRNNEIRRFVQTYWR